MLSSDFCFRSVSLFAWTILIPIQVLTADDSVVPGTRLFGAGYGSGQAQTAGRVYRVPLFVTPASVQPTVKQKAKTQWGGQRAQLTEIDHHHKSRGPIAVPKATPVAVPVTLLAWNLPCETGISSHKTSSEQQISIESDGSLDLTQGWVRFPDSSARVVRGIQAFEKFSLIADVTCDGVRQSGPARILSCSKDTNQRNFTLGQQLDAFVFRIRTSQRDINGTHREVVFGKVLLGVRQQVSVQYNGCTLTCSVDGTVVAEQKMEIDFESWQQFAMQAGNEATGERPWAGHIHGLLMLPDVDYCQPKLDCRCKDDES